MCHVCVRCNERMSMGESEGVSVCLSVPDIVTY